MKLNPKFTALWILWIVGFLVFEGVAIAIGEKGDTLSEHVWWGISRSPVVWFVALGFFVWLVAHFFGYGRIDDWFRSLPKWKRKKKEGT